MSQEHNSRDNQALLQSMLQRLKLQAGTTNIEIEQNATGGQNLHSETPDLQTVNNNNPINGVEPTDNIKREFTVNGKLQDVDISGASGHSQEHGVGSQSGQHFSPKAASASISSEARFTLSNSETKDISQSQSTEQKQDQDCAFVPKVYTWSTQNTETQNNEAAFKGVFGATGQNTVTNNQNTTNNRKQQASENKTRKWTQKLKEKWRERPGSFGKKERFADKITHENSPQYQPPAHFNLPSIEESGGTPTLEDRTDRLQIQTSNGNDECMRSTNDFDLGLGSFSLLDEIVSGQEWAKFLNPATSASIHPSQETKYHDKPSSINSMLSEHNVGTNSHIFGTSREAPHTDIAVTQVSPDPPLHVGMITEKTQMQSEPMDHGQSQSDMQVTVSDEQPQHTTKREFTYTVGYSSLRGRNSLSRKRQHQSSECIEAKFPRVVTNGNITVDDGSVFLPDNQVMGNIDGRLMSAFSPTTKPVPRGVLKSTLSCDSTNSVETASKKRRMEETRHVHFSEEIIAIEPPELGSDMSESEESEESEDSFLEEDSEEHTEPTLLGPVRPEVAAPARRRALPAWIRALKRRNTGKKPR